MTEKLSEEVLGRVRTRLIEVIQREFSTPFWPTDHYEVRSIDHDAHCVWIGLYPGETEYSEPLEVFTVEVSLGQKENRDE